MSFESDSQTSLSQRDLSQDDGSSLNSGNSSVDLPPPVDDKERLALLDSAINWIKEELAGMRDRDKDILKELLQAHSSIQDIHRQQKQALEVEHEFENRKSFGSMDSFDESDQTSNHSSNRSLERTLVSSHTSVHVGVNHPPITRYSVDKIALRDDKKNADDDLLRSFLGEENIEKLTYFSNSSHISVDSEDGVSPSLVQDRNKINSSQSMAELKVHAKKEGRSSVAFEMQMLRQKLQEEAKEELAAFDKKFDSPTHSSFLEVEKTSYRHSILNRMEEILNPGDHGNHVGSSGNHIRQSSEPVVLGNMYWSTSNGNTSNNDKEYGNPPPVQPRLSQPGFNSFRLPSHHHSSQLNRTGSGFGKTHSSERHSVKIGQQTHYDTTVVGKRRSRPSSRTSTLERKHPLQYSVESLNGEVGTTERVYNGEMNGFDVDNPEHKSITNRRGSGSSNEAGNMDPSNHKPKQTSFRAMQHQPSPLLRKDSGSPEIYPELSPVTSPSRLNYKIDPYMTSSDAMEQYFNGKSEETFVYTPYSEAKKQFNRSSSAPMKRRNKIKGSDKTWL